MSRVHEYEQFHEEEAQLIEDPELNAELEAAIEEADNLKPEEWIPFDEMMRRLRNGEGTLTSRLAQRVRSMRRDVGGFGIATRNPRHSTKTCTTYGNCCREHRMRVSAGA